MGLEDKTSFDKPKSKKTLGKEIGIGFLVLGIGAAGIMRYKLYEDGVINYWPIVTLYRKIMSKLPLKKNIYNQKK